MIRIENELRHKNLYIDSLLGRIKELQARNSNFLNKSHFNRSF